MWHNVYIYIHIIYTYKTIYGYIDIGIDTDINVDIDVDIHVDVQRFSNDQNLVRVL